MILTLFLGFALFTMLVYGIFAMGAWELNMGAWPDGARVGLGFIVGVVGCVILVISVVQIANDLGE